MKKLAIISTHPIQYNAPLFKLLQHRGSICIKVFYTWGDSVLRNKFDPGFKKNINWDIPLLEGYEHIFEKNLSHDPGSHHFRGIDNPELIQHIEEWNADAILVYGWRFKSHLRCLRYFHNKIPVYFRGDSNLIDDKKGLKNLIRTLFLKWVYSYVDVAFYVGSQNKKYYLKHGLKESQLVFAPHAVDNMRFYDQNTVYTERAIEWRRRLNIANDVLTFLFAGKLEAKKDPELLIRAFLAIQKPDSTLIIVGNGVLENNLKKKYSAENKIHFIDFQNQSMMPVVYRLGDIFVLPSAGPGETWGLCVNEAMACSKSILVSNRVGCSVDLVVEGENGYTFLAGNVNDLIHKMLLLYNRKYELISMGKVSLDTIKQWDYDFIANRIEKELINSHAEFI